MPRKGISSLIRGAWFVYDLVLKTGEFCVHFQMPRSVEALFRQMHQGAVVRVDGELAVR